MFQTNKFVKWTQKDEHGKFSHVGQVTASTISTVTMDVHGLVGLLTLDKDDGTFTKASKPAGWNTPSSTVAVVPKPKKAARAPGSGTKLDQVVALVRANQCHTRKEYIDLIVDQIGMTPAGASTYYSNAKKVLTRS